MLRPSRVPLPVQALSNCFLKLKSVVLRLLISLYVSEWACLWVNDTNYIRKQSYLLSLFMFSILWFYRGGKDFPQTLNSNYYTNRIRAQFVSPFFKSVSGYWSVIYRSDELCLFFYSFRFSSRYLGKNAIEKLWFIRKWRLTENPSNWLKREKLKKSKVITFQLFVIQIRYFCSSFTKQGLKNFWIPNLKM